MFFELLHAKSCRIIWKLFQKVSFEPKACKIEQKLWLRSCPDLLLTPYIKKHTRENIWNIARKYIYIYICGIYIRNIHKYLWYKINRNTGAALGGAPMGRPPSAAAPLGLCFWSFYIIDIYGYSLYIPYIFQIFPKYVPYIFPSVFLNLWSQE